MTLSTIRRFDWSTIAVIHQKEENMNDAAVLFAAILAGSLVVTKTVDFARETLDRNNSASKWVWIISSFIIGVTYAVGWQIDLTEAFKQLVPALAPLPHMTLPVGTDTVTYTSTAAADAALLGSNPTIAGEIITGLVIGAGADAWHKILANFSAGTAAKTAKATGCCK